MEVIKATIEAIELKMSLQDVMLIEKIIQIAIEEEKVIGGVDVEFSTMYEFFKGLYETKIIPTNGPAIDR